MSQQVTPHFKVPFRWGFNGSAQCLEQDSPEDIVQCVLAVLATKLGSRIDLPSFGIRSLVLEENGPSLEAIEAAVQEWEPRAALVLKAEHWEDIKSKLVQVGVEVNPNG